MRVCEYFMFSFLNIIVHYIVCLIYNSLFHYNLIE